MKLRYKCSNCGSKYEHGENALSCCKNNKIKRVIKCQKCGNDFQDERYALACCRKKKVSEVKEYPKCVWIKVENIDDIPDHVSLFGMDGDGDMWFVHSRENVDEWFYEGNYFMIPPDLPGRFEK